MSYELMYSPGAASLAPHILLRELGVTFSLSLIDTRAGAHKTPAYLKLNPNGRVPTLIADGRPVFESAAICLLLCERHPGLAPAPGSPARPGFLQWMVFLTNTLQEAFMAYFHADHYAATAAAQAEVKARAEATVGTLFGRLEQALAAGGPWLCGDGFSAADIYLFMLTRWGRNLAAPPAKTLPLIGRHYAAVGARPATREAFAAEGLA